MKAPEKNRVSLPGMESSASDGPNGFFLFRSKCSRFDLAVIASDGMGWDHVSVSVPRQYRLPTWEEMDFIKNQFWDAEEIVMQLHVPASQHVSNAEVLHLWRPQKQEIPLPPSITVGIKGVKL